MTNKQLIKIRAASLKNVGRGQSNNHRQDSTEKADTGHDVLRLLAQLIVDFHVESQKRKQSRDAEIDDSEAPHCH
ncbi:MAG: hypothetical protein ACFCVE_09740 [Phycisphaerae bacterium]